MSRQLMSVKKYLLLCLPAMALGAFGMWVFQEPRSDSGSISMASRAPQFAGKPHAAFYVSLHAPNGIAISPDDEVLLTGAIRPAQDFEGPIRFHWELPQGTHIVQGQASGEWIERNEHGVYEVSLVLKGFSQEEFKLVALHGFVDDVSGRLGNSAVITSRPDDSYDMLAKGSFVQDAPAAAKNGRTLSGKIVR